MKQVSYRWRIQSASTRDHSLSPPPIVSISHNFIQGRKYASTEELENWHSNLCYGFISEYKRYLQTLGFIPLQIENTHKKHGYTLNFF